MEGGITCDTMSEVASPYFSVTGRGVSQNSPNLRDVIDQYSLSMLPDYSV